MSIGKSKIFISFCSIYVPFWNFESFTYQAMCHTLYSMKTSGTFGWMSAFLFLAFSGCSSISHTLVAPEVQPPGIADEQVIDIVASTGPGREVTLFTDASNRPPSYSTNFATNQRRHGVAYGGLGYALKGVSFSGGLLGANSLIEGIWVGGKLQVLGKQGLLGQSPLHLTGWGRLGLQRSNKSGNQNGEFGPGGYPWEAERSGSFFNLGLSVGYEIASGFIPYIGYGKGTAHAKATVEQAISSDGLSPAATYTNSYDADVTSWGGGVQLGSDNVRFAASLQRTRTEVGSFRVLDSSLGLSLAFKIHGPNVSATVTESP